MAPAIIYVSGALFSLSEQEYNKSLVNLLSSKMEDAEFILPQNLTKLYLGDKDFLDKIFRECLASIDKAHALVSILEGPDVDSGTAIEMGYAYARNKPIIGIRTDFRSAKNVNLMVAGVCREFLWLPSYQVELNQVANEIASALKRAL